VDLILDLFSQLTAWFDSLTGLITDSPLTYLLILALAAIDAFFPIVPAETIVTAAAVLAGQGQLNIVWIMIAAGFGAFIGDNIAYWIGRAAGRPLIERLLRGNFERLEGVERQFEKRGGIFIIIGRFVPGGRTMIAMSAGVIHYSWPKFLLFDAIAAVIWALQASLPGYIGGSLIQDKPWLAMIIGFALSAVVAISMTAAQHWWERRNLDPDEAEELGVDLADDAEGEPEDEPEVTKAD
jgi:membrane protein DedA with SNARE-associated domain